MNDSENSRFLTEIRDLPVECEVMVVLNNRPVGLKGFNRLLCQVNAKQEWVNVVMDRSPKIANPSKYGYIFFGIGIPTDNLTALRSHVQRFGVKHKHGLGMGDIRRYIELMNQRRLTLRGSSATEQNADAPAVEVTSTRPSTPEVLAPGSHLPRHIDWTKETPEVEQGEPRTLEAPAAVTVPTPGDTSIEVTASAETDTAARRAAEMDPLKTLDAARAIFEAAGYAILQVTEQREQQVAELESLKEALGQSEAEIKSLRIKADDLTLQNETLRQADAGRASLEGEVLNLRQENLRLRQQNEDIESRASEETIQLTALRQENEKLQSEYSKLSHTLEQMQQLMGSLSRFKK